MLPLNLQKLWLKRVNNVPVQASTAPHADRAHTTPKLVKLVDHQFAGFARLAMLLGL